MLGAIALGLIQPAPTSAQDDRGILGDLRARMTSGSPLDTWERARSLASAAQAATLMKELVTQTRDPDVSALAALWLGHYSYGGGRLREAHAYFERATQAGPEETRAEARFWIAHCGNLLATSQPQPSALPVVEPMEHVSEVLAGLAAGDAAIRMGDPRDAVRRYLALEGEARRLHCLAPLYYRVALVVSATEASGRTGDSVGWSTVRSWEAAVAMAPERAIVALLESGRMKQGDLLTEQRGEPPSDPGTQFSEPTEEPAPELPEVSPEPIPPPAPETPAAAAPAVEDDDSLRYFVIQLGAYHDRRSARREMERLTTQGLSVRMEPGRDAEGREIFRIRLGREQTRDEAKDLAARLVAGMEYEILEVRQ